MAKITPELKRFLEITKRINNGLDLSKEDLKFYSEFHSGIDEDKLSQLEKQINDLKAEGKIDPEITGEFLGLAYQKLHTDPQYREGVIELKKQADAGKTSEKVAEGINTILSGLDIQQSINQINKSNRLLSGSQRPHRPLIPTRDQYLQQALRNAQIGAYDVSQAIAPAKAEIADQYLNDLQNAKVASAGQAGAYGAYLQNAANRRARANLNLTPVGNNVRMQNQALYNELLGQRLNETQNIYNAQAQMYPYDLNQYQYEQQMAGHLGAVGRENLRRSLANLGGNLAQGIGQYTASRRYRNALNNIRNVSPSAATAAEKGLGYLYGEPNYSLPLDVDAEEAQFLRNKI